MVSIRKPPRVGVHITAQKRNSDGGAWPLISIISSLLFFSVISALPQSFQVLSGFSPVQNGTNAFGRLPNGVGVLAGGQFYGTTEGGGVAGGGTVFTLDTSGTNFQVLHTFIRASGNTTNIDGENPEASLVLSGDTLYGTALLGGTNGSGTIFSLNTNASSFTVLHTFGPASSGSFTNIDGINPFAALLLEGGNLYGTARRGGTNGQGTIFALDTGGTNYAVLHTFSAVNGSSQSNFDGALPSSDLILSGSNIYGGTLHGGTFGEGVIFSLDTNGGNFTVLHAFSAASGTPLTNADGVEVSLCPLLLAGGKLFGAAENGGLNGSGTIYSLDTTGSNFCVLHSFSALSGTPATNADGGNPLSQLCLSGNTIYGGAVNGGQNGTGTLFAMTTNGANFTVLHTFSPTSGPNPPTNWDGANPEGDAVLSGNTFFGGTLQGGTNGAGTIFELQLPAPAVSFGSFTSQPGNNFGFGFVGGAGASYVIQGNGDLSNPSGWQDLSTNVTDADGNSQFTDSSVSNRPVRFYRAVPN